MNRYIKNMTSYSPDELAEIRNTHFGIVGCGGLGGQVITSLARFGVGTLTIIDGDVFDETNLNRQVFAYEDNLGMYKTDETKKELQRINSDIKVINHNIMFDKDNGCDLLKDCDVVIDCLDTISARFDLMEVCAKLNIPFVHGAIAGFYGQVTTVFPGDDTLNRIYPKGVDKGSETKLGNPPFTPQLLASFQVCQGINLILNKGDILQNEILHIDLLSLDCTRIQI